MAAAASLMPRLASLAGADAGASTRAAALGALEAAAVRFGDVFVVGDDASNAKMAAAAQTRKGACAAFAAPLLATTPAMVDALGAPARAVVAAAANATAAVVRALGPRALPALPSAVPALFAAARKAAATLAGALDESSGVSGGVSEAVLAARDDEGHVLVACLRAVTALMDRLGGFLSPHLSDVLALLLSPSLVPGTKEKEETTTPEKEKTKTAATTAAAHAAALRETLPRATPPRLLLGPLDNAMRAALGDADAGESLGRVSASAAAAALRMAASCVASSPPNPGNNSSALVSMLLRALDVRRSHPASFDGEHIDQVEGAAAEAFVTAASSQTESAFAPTLATATEWAKARASDPEAARARLSRCSASRPRSRTNSGGCSRRSRRPSWTWRRRRSTRRRTSPSPKARSAGEGEARLDKHRFVFARRVPRRVRRVARARARVGRCPAHLRARLGRDHRRGAVQPAAPAGDGVSDGEAALRRREIARRLVVSDALRPRRPARRRSARAGRGRRGSCRVRRRAHRRGAG